MNALTILRAADLYSSFLGVCFNCKHCGLTTMTQLGQSLLTFPHEKLTVNIFCKLPSGWGENMSDFPQYSLSQFSLVCPQTVSGWVTAGLKQAVGFSEEEC